MFRIQFSTRSPADGTSTAQHSCAVACLTQLRFSTDVANIGQTGYERPNITGNPMAAQHTLKQWFNTAAFSTPTLYTFGNMGRNSLRTPFYQSYNLGVFKELKYHERYSMRLNLESFNFLNHKIFAQPNSSYGTSAFGAMSSTATASRTVQASVKLAF